ncbi:MAG TPA: GNAT family N-acetyltransferase, partial [Acidimicrobiales bacterium]|nr:GNAT family N-acetyltransferase [Acidimicrobiales bacterium]
MTESGSVDQTRGGRAAGKHVVVEEVAGVDDELVASFAALVPQLSSSTPPPGPGELAALIASPAITLLVARADPDGSGGKGPIVGTLTLAVFPIPTGVRAWIEDVVVDQGARGMGVGEALTLGALEQARARGA